MLEKEATGVQDRPLIVLLSCVRCFWILVHNRNGRHTDQHLVYNYNLFTMKRVFSHILFFFLAGFLSSESIGAQTKDKPSILWLFVDNVGYGDLGCYGNKEILTPNIDRLAKQGVRCTDFYIGSPSCMPSRGALMTGRHPIRNGLNRQIYKVDEHEQIALPHSEIIAPGYLKEAGYVTGCFGKWNLGFAPGSRPVDRGFDEYFGTISGNADYYTYIYNGRNDLYRNNEPATAEGYSTDVFAEAACEFIERNKDRPFFCYVPFNAAHYPYPRNKPAGTPCIWQAPDSAFERYGYSPETLDEYHRYQAVITAMDDGIGKILDQLDRLNLSKKTLVVFLSDHGAFMAPTKGLGVASNKPFRVGADTLWEGGLRVPSIIRWPGVLPEGATNSEMMVSMDLLPMALQAAGMSLPEDRTLDGYDITPCLKGEADSPHEFLCWEWGSDSSAIRKGRYKLLKERTTVLRNWQLFDLQTDPGETADLTSRLPNLARQLKSEWEEWRKKVQAK